MANNRMFLVYRPTGEAVLVGKRMANGWYTDGHPGLSERLDELFRAADKAAEEDSTLSQDDFAIALEEGKCPHTISNWAYGAKRENGIRELVIDESVPYGPGVGMSEKLIRDDERDKCIKEISSYIEECDIPGDGSDGKANRNVITLAVNIIVNNILRSGRT